VESCLKVDTSTASFEATAFDVVVDYEESFGRSLRGPYYCDIE
jgi:hypothetical protein